MSKSDSKDLLADYSRNKTIAARNNLIEHYLYLVKRTAQSMAPAYRKYIQFDDLIGYGVFGLIDAIEKYDASSTASFETYARIRIRGSILDALRKSDWASSYMRQKIKQVENAIVTLATEKGTTPTEAEVAEYLQMDITQVQNALDESYAFNMVYLDDLLSDNNTAHNTADYANTPEKKFEEKELVDIMAQCIDGLTEKERLILRLYYQEELTLKEIGLVVGLSESRISQIHSKLLIELRKKIEEKIT